MESDLRRSFRKFRGKLDASHFIAWRTRTDGVAEYVDQQWLDYVGITANQALGGQWLSAFHPDDVATLSGTWRWVLASEQPGEGEVRMRRFDGVYRWFHFRAEPLQDSNGQFISWIGTNPDIEEREFAEDESRLTERLYTQLFHSIPVALWQLDESALVVWIKTLRADGVTDLIGYLRQNAGSFVRMMERVVVEEVNERAVKMFGASDRGQLLQEFGVLWRRNPDTFRRAIESRFRGEAAFEEEVSFTTLDCREIAVHFVVRRICMDTVFERGLIAMIDTSDRSWAQEKLEQAQTNLAHAARISMLGELTASIAHEVNQPIAAIRTNGETALRWLERDEPNLAKARVSIQRMIDDAGRASGVVTRIRGMAAGRAPEYVAVALHHVIGQSLMFVQRELQSNGVSLSLDLAQPLPSVRGDHTQLQQVVVNLTMNAAHAVAKLEATRRNVSIRTYQSNPETVCCIIEDSGAGIDPVHLPHLFDSFFTTKESGMGLGLPIAKSIVEAHGGHIRADNQSIFGGARFIVELPASNPQK